MRTAFRLLWWEGAFAMAYETWVGPAYVSGLAGEVGAPVGLVVLLTSLPWIGLTGQLLGLWAFERVPSLKRYTVLVAAAARATWLFPLALAAWWGWRLYAHGEAFPTLRWFTWLAVFACTAGLLASSSSVAWQSWMKGLIPVGFQGRFFGIRQRHVMAALISANLLAATVVGWKPDGYRLGYALVWVTALISAAISTILLARVPDSPVASVAASHGKPHGLRKTVREALGNARFRRVLIFGGCFTGALQIAGPYFPYYYTRDLHIPMSSVALWIMLSNVGAFLAAGYWGRRLDRTGKPVAMLWIVGHMIALSPLPYVVPSVEWVRAVAPLEFVLNGIAWSGWVVAMMRVLFSACPEGKNAVYFSLYTASTGFFGALGTILGGNLAIWLAPWGGFRAVWVVAIVLRLAVVWGLVRTLEGPQRKTAEGSSLAVSP